MDTTCEIDEKDSIDSLQHRDEESRPLIQDENHNLQSETSHTIHYIFHTCGALALFGSLAFLLVTYLHLASDEACERRNWAWSPMMDGFKYEWRQYDADVLPDNFLGPPTAERREAWRLTHEQGWISFPESRLPLLNKTKDERDWWRLPAPRQDQLVALPEIVHQSHCVGFIYSFAHREHWDFSTVPEIANELVYKLHANHCFFAIMRMITCNADVTPVVFQLDHSRKLGTWKPRDAPHRCKDWAALNAWQAENKVCKTNCQPWDLTGERPPGAAR